MNKIKKAIADLKSYLGKDSRGVHLLDVVARQVNDLRKEAASSLESLEQQKVVASGLREQVAFLQSEIDALRRGLQEKTALITQRELEIKRQKSAMDEMQKGIDRLFEPISIPKRDIQSERIPGQRSARSVDELPPLFQSVQRFVQVFDSLRREVYVAPKMKGKKDQVVSYRLEDIIADYTDRDMIRLGKFVTCHSMVWGACCVTPDMQWKDAAVGRKTFSDDQLAQIVRWLARHNIDMRSDSEILTGTPLKTGKDVARRRRDEFSYSDFGAS